MSFWSRTAKVAISLVVLMLLMASATNATDYSIRLASPTNIATATGAVIDVQKKGRELAL